MDQVFAMDGCQALKNAFDDVAGFLELDQSLLFGALIGVDVSFVAKLHNDKDPALI